MEYFIHLKHSLKILYKYKHFPGSYSRKREWVFFSEHSVDYYYWATAGEKNLVTYLALLTHETEKNVYLHYTSLTAHDGFTYFP